MTTDFLNPFKDFNEAELHIKRLLEAAVSRYGSEYVDLNLESIEGQDEPVLSIIYHSPQNSFGIHSGLSTQGINFKHMDRLADALDIGFNDYDANFDWRAI